MTAQVPEQLVRDFRPNLCNQRRFRTWEPWTPPGRHDLEVNVRRLLILCLSVFAVAAITAVQPASAPKSAPAVAGPVEPMCVDVIQPVGPSDLTVTVCTPPM